MAKTSSFLKHSFIMASALALSNVLNMIFQIIMVRWLTPVDYGVINTLFAIFMIVSIPGMAVQTVVSKFVSAFDAREEYAKIIYLFYKYLKRTSFYALVILLVVLPFTPLVSGFLRLDRNVYLIWLCVIIYVSILLPFYQGLIRGLQRFLIFGMSIIANSIVRLVLGMGAIYFGFKINGILWAVLIAMIVAMAVLYYPARIFFKNQSTGAEKVSSEEIYRFSWPTIWAFLFIMILTNIDIIIVKHYFSPQTAGEYSVASMAGKIMFFLPQALVMVLLPKVSYLASQMKTSAPIYYKAIFLTFLIGACVFFSTLYYPQLIGTLLAGDRFAGFRLMALFFIFSMGFFALVNVIVHYNLSVNNVSFVKLMGILTFFYTGTLIAFHQSIMSMLGVMSVSSVIIAAALFWQSRKHIAHEVTE